MIKFKIVRFKNLMSTGNVFTEIPLDVSPTTLVTGKNGSGKSTMIEAITFALFNKAYRDITKPALVNTINNKNCVAEVEFDIGAKKYKIVRGIKPAIFEIWIDDTLRNSVPGTDDQKFLEDVILQLNYKTFVQICIIGNATYTPFMALTTPNRRDFIEDLLDIRIFSLMTEVLKKKVSESKQKIRDLEAELSLHTSKISVQESYIQNLHDDRARKNAELSEKIAIAQASVTKTLAEIELLDQEKEGYIAQSFDIQNLEESVEKLKPLQYEMTNKKRTLLQEISFFRENYDCPVCKQGIDEEFKLSAIDERSKKHDTMEAGIERINKKITSSIEMIDNCKVLSRQISALERKIFEAQSTVKSEQKYIAALTAEIDTEQNRMINIDEEKAKLKSLAKAAISINNSKVSATEDKHYLDLQSILLKDTGIKAKVVKQYVPIINKLVNKFLSALDFFCTFDLDEAFNESIKSRGRDDLTYHSFSEGEKLKIDMAMLFTWITIAKLKNTVATNLLILDEVADAGLDNTSSGLVVDILREFSKTAHVFVITHHPELYFDKFDSLLQFEKRNNYSVVV
jgi:DNA repair exonuclease SbcCD ATPase subunit